MAPRPEVVQPRYGFLGTFFFLLGMSLLFFHGQLKTSDEIQMAATTSGIAQNASLHFPQEIDGLHFSGYGVGTPIAGVPAWFLTKLMHQVLQREEMGFNLLPLTNGVLFALLGMMLSMLLEGQRRWGAVAIALCASPLFPVSLTYYSEMLASAGMVALVVALWREEGEGRAPTGLALAGALVAVMARVAMAPMLMLVLFWGWRIGGRRRTIAFGFAGIVAGIAAWVLQNHMLRGNMFASGYEGQDFTTPLLTGLHGLLLSPERGLLVFYPVLLAVFACWRVLGGRGRALALLASAVLLFTLVFHALFWTWHGGWTFGPRFMLPAVALFIPAVAEIFMKARELERPLRAFFYLTLLWSALLSYIYSQYSAMDWWNQVWPFFQQENQWLFMPQLSLWQQWFLGIPLPAAQRTLGLERMVFTGLGLATVLVALYPLLTGWRGYTGMDPQAREELERAFRFRIASRTAFMLAGALFLFGVVPLLRGPRGWSIEDSPAPAKAPMFLTLQDRTGTYEGWLDYPLNGNMTLALRADALYQVHVDLQPVLEQKDPSRPHLRTAEVALTPGLHFIEVKVFPQNQHPMFQLYWSWGGEGVYLSPAGGEYLMPRQLTPLEHFATKIWRRRFILSAGILALLLLLFSLPAPKPRQNAILS